MRAAIRLVICVLALLITRGNAAPAVVATGLTNVAALTSDGNSVTLAKKLYFAETVGTKTYLRSVDANGGAVSTLFVTDALLDAGAYRGIHRIVLDAAGFWQWGGIGGYEQSYIFSTFPSAFSRITNNFAGGALIGRASTDLVYFDQFSRLITHRMFTNTENVLGTGFFPRSSVDSFSEMYFQNDSDRRIYRVQFGTTVSSVSPFSEPMTGIGSLFLGAGVIYFATPNRVVRFSSTGATEIVMSGVALAADSKFIYFVDGTNLKYMPVAGGNSGVLATVPASGVTGMIVADHFSTPVLYWSQSDGVILKLAAPTTAPPTGSSRLVNLSILAPLAAGETLTLGTAIGGAGTSGTKAILVRAAGPSLTQLGVSGVLANPAMTLNYTTTNPATIVATNAGWGGSTSLSNAFAQVGAFPYASATSNDSALSQSGATALLAGNYTVQINDAQGGSGTVIAELYDATPSSVFNTTTPRLVNVSVFKQVAANASLTAGLVVSGSGSMRILMRAVGPSLGLAPFGIAGVMASPKLELFNNESGQMLSSNVGWGGSTVLTSAFTSVGAFQLANGNTKDSALLVTLPPGQYSARVSGSDGSGGTVIVEVYEVP